MQRVPIDSIHPLKNHPNKYPAILIEECKAVLVRSGNVRGVVVLKSTREILDGHLYWLGAKALGWTEIYVVWAGEDVVPFSNAASPRFDVNPSGEDAEVSPPPEQEVVPTKPQLTDEQIQDRQACLARMKKYLHSYDRSLKWVRCLGGAGVELRLLYDDTTGAALVEGAVANVIKAAQWLEQVVDGLTTPEGPGEK